MRQVTPGKLLCVCAACFMMGSLWGGRMPVGHAAFQAPANQPVPFPVHDRLGANVYLQTSAEYRACCHQIYKCAEQRLSTLALARPANPAIVMDLDETVIDNSAFQTFLLKNNLEYTEELWAEYEQNHPQDVTLVPGAKQFIQNALSRGIAFVFISNRAEVYLKSTVSILDKHQIGPAEWSYVHVYLKPKEGSTDKSARREAVNAKFNVLMYFGDNLRDFSEAFTAKKLAPTATLEDRLKAIEERGVLADEAACHWGVDWFVIPNPVYGEWEKLMGSDPKLILHPTTMKVKLPATF